MDKRSQKASVGRGGTGILSPDCASVGWMTVTTGQMFYRLFTMNADRIRILTVEPDDDGLVITFSDGTTAGYLVDELLELRPHRLHTADFHEPPRNTAG